ncbi:glycerol-3-phosphate acyltransferase [Gemella sp. GH3]|uniref:glycerol-3-phosphate acyltransferase n=1 Tax=unclassified Gemella TaxID=2624949 RepID=UPI0015D052B4|nr:MULTISPECIES: glycerol-3-phosphate acyltransferase [unclassified Gemella]MBF0714093.1 glycerol-3-phosphate acyltransferase [Gemella sp. GH3.1]NYS51045.1 glycerol-3-phosphate acyltransferase [Gemella sp. GH3]
MILNIIYFVSSYLIGNILGGNVLKHFYKEDISSKGSGNIGARNAGRVLGTKAFLFVATIDLFKSFLVVILLKILNVDIFIITICLFFVVLGHVMPILNSFNGGKGVATFVGGIVALSPNLLFVFILGFLLIAFITRSATIGFYSTLPMLIYIYYMDFKSWQGSLVFIITIIILFVVSINDTTNAFNKYFMKKQMKK